VLTTPPPPKFRPPRWTPNSQSTSGTPRRTPANVREKPPYDTEREQGESEEEENGDTSTPHPREEQEGMRAAFFKRFSIPW